MKTKTSKQVLALMLLSFFIFAGTTVFAQKVNLAGNWTYNESKSKLGEGRNRAPSTKLNITQDETSLNMEKLGKTQNGDDFTTKEKYTLDGKESENSGFMNSVKKSVVTWTTDKKTLTITSSTTIERDGNKMDIKSVENYMISDDGNSLTIDATITSPRGERKQTLVYEKAK